MTVEGIGKKLDDAIGDALAKLSEQSGKQNITLDDVDVEVLCSGSWLRKAKVRMTFDESSFDEQKAAEEARQREEERTQPRKEFRKERNFDRRERTDKPERSDRPARKERDRRETAPVVEQVKTEEKPSEPVKPVAEEQVEMARAYVGELLRLMGVEASLVINTDKGSIDIDIVTEDSSVIGHHGEVLDSIQQLCKRAVEEGEDKHLAVNVDCKGYREGRERTLVSLAHRMAAKAVKTGRKVLLEPMSNTQRKIIHATLNDNDKVFTKSEGKEPNRRVVIIPKRSRNNRGYNNRKRAPGNAATAPETASAATTPVAAPEATASENE